MDPVKVEILMNGNLSQGMDTAKTKTDLLEASIKRLSIAAGGMFTFQKVVEFTKAVVSVRTEVESLSISFETLLGSGQKADEFFGELKDFAVKTPLMLNDLASGAQTMLGFNIEAEKVIPTLKQIGDISMGNADRFKSLTLAFSQMSATGKLMGQDLLQMINSGFNPLTIMAQTTGKSISQLKEEMSAGAISSEMVAQAFADATAEGGKFNGMLEKQSKGLQGQISNFQGAVDDALNAIGEKGQSFITDAVSGATYLVKHYEDIGKAIETLVVSYGTYRTALIVNLALEGKALTSIKALAVAQSLLNKVVLANPYVLAASAIVGLVSVLVIFNKETDHAKVKAEQLNDTYEKIKANTEDRINKAKDLINAIQGENQRQEDRILLFQSLKNLYPEIFSDMELEKLRVMDLKDAYELLNGAQSKRTGADKQAELNRLYREKSQLEASITGNRNTGGYKYQRLAEQDEQKLIAVNEHIAKLEKEKADFLAEQSAKEEHLITVAERRKKKQNELISAEKKLNAMKADSSTASDEEIEKQEKLVKSLREYLNIKVKDIAPDGSIKEIEVKIKKLKEQLENATNDEARTAIQKTINELEKQLERITVNVVWSASKAAEKAVNVITEKINVSLDNLKVKATKDFAQEEIEAEEKKIKFLKDTTKELQASVKEVDAFVKTKWENKDAKKAEEDRIQRLKDMVNMVSSVSSAFYQASDALWSFAEAYNDSDLMSVAGTLESISMVGDIVGKLLSGNITDVIQAGIQFITMPLTAAARQKQALDEIRLAMQQTKNELSILNFEAEYAFSDGIFGADKYGNALKALEAYCQALDKLNSKIAFNGYNHRNNRNEATSPYAGLENIQIVTGHEKTGLFGWGKGKDTYSSVLSVYKDLIDENGKFNATIAETIIANQKMSEQDKQALQDMIEWAKEAEEAYEELNSYLTDIFGDLGGVISDALTDAFRNSTDAAKTFVDSVEKMLEDLAQQMIYTVTTAPALEKAQKDMMDVMQNADLNDEQKFNNYISILDQMTDGIMGQQSLYNSLLEKYQDIAKDKGYELWQKDSTTQTGKTGAYATASQESITKLEGLYTSMLIYEASIDSNVENVVANLLIVLTQLQRIESNTASCSESLGKISGDIESVKNDISTLKRDGIKTR